MKNRFTVNNEVRVVEISASLSGLWLWDWPDIVCTRIVWQSRRDRAVLTDGTVGRLRVGRSSAGGT